MLDAKENRENKTTARIPGGEECTKGFSAAIFFLAVFFRVTHDALSERGTTRSLQCLNDFCFHRDTNLNVVQGDVFDPESLVQVLEGKNAVLSCLGFQNRTFFTPTTLYSKSMTSITTAMEK